MKEFIEIAKTITAREWLEGIGLAIGFGAVVILALLVL